MELKHYLCAALPAFVACAAPGSDVGEPTGLLSCTTASCVRLTDVKRGQSINLQGTGIKRLDDGMDDALPVAANALVAIDTGWSPSDAGVFDLAAKSATDTDLFFASGAAQVTGYEYARSDGMIGSYDYVEAFTINDAMDNKIYAGSHGFTPTAAALGIATTRAIKVAYRGEAFGDIAYQPVTGQTGSVEVSGGTALLETGFGDGAASRLTLTFANNLANIEKRLKISFTQVYRSLASFSSNLEQPTVEVDGSPADPAFDQPTIKKPGTVGNFYGWDIDRAVPAEVGGIVKLTGNGGNNVINLLFLGTVGPPDPVCTPDMACNNLAGLSEHTSLAGAAVNPGDRSIYTTVADWRPATAGGSSMAEVRSVTGTTLFTAPAVRQILDPDVPNSYAVPTNDFDDDSATPATAMTDGYDFVQAYTVSNGAQTELYRGVHGVPFGSSLPTSGSASYNGRYLVNEGSPNWVGRDVENLVTLTFGMTATIAINVPAIDIRTDLTPSGSTAVSLNMLAVDFDSDRGTFRIADGSTEITGSPAYAYNYQLSAGLYGFNPNAGGQGIGGPEEVAGVAAVTGASGALAGTNFTFLFVAKFNSFSAP